MTRKKLLLMFLLSLLAMFASTYVMLATIEHFYLNINKLYMSLLMVGLMALVNYLIMRSMYESKKVGYIVLAFGIISTFLSLFLIRTQGLVGDENFLRSMIPHHSSAILMCEQATITDPEIIEVCEQIVKTQKEEIEQMQDLLNR